MGFKIHLFTVIEFRKKALNSQICESGLNKGTVQTINKIITKINRFINRVRSHLFLQLHTLVLNIIIGYIIVSWEKVNVLHV